MKLTYYEILENVSKKKTKKEKIEELKRNSCAPLKTILGYALDPNVVWLLPEGEPPYTPLKDNSDVDGRLDYEIRKLYYFVDGPTPEQKNLQQTRREQMFIEILESVDPKEAKLLLAIKEKKLPFKGISKAVVAEAFPNIAKNW